MNIVIILLSDDYAHDFDIPVLIISGLVLFVFAYASSKKIQELNKKFLQETIYFS